MSAALIEMPDAQVVEQTLVNGDLARLSPSQRVFYYNALCKSLGLNPLTKPFDYITLNGKLTLYAKKDCTEQLRSTRIVSIQIVGRELVEDCYVVTARASIAARQDESIGAVSIADLKGDARANAMMKAETKAKRRVTLSICGLGMLDETELETIPTSSMGAIAVAPDTVVNVATGETVPASDRPQPPPGYHYIDSYRISNGWHEIKLLGYDAQGGAVTLSTKTKAGELAGQAYQQGLPVRVETKPKPNGKGEAYLQAVHVWKPEAVDEADQRHPGEDEVF